MQKSSTLTFAVAAAICLSQATNADPAVLAEYPSGTFLENLTVQADGTIAFTSYFARQLGQLETNGRHDILVDLPVHPVGILATETGFIITAHGTPFTEGSEFARTQQILLLDADGDIVSSVDVPDALFLNGLTQTTTGQVLFADSIAGTIWEFDPATGSVDAWLTHELLTQNPDIPFFVPGANGVKQDGDHLLVSNSGRKAIYEIALGEDGSPASDPVIFAQTGPVDDFYVDTDRFVFTTHGAALQAIEADGSITTLLNEGCDGCTSVVRRGDAYLVLTTGGLLEGHANPARILSTPAK